ncbi:lysophospholipase L1-like esterase [Prauserella shujinwangii]|uniref:Lysophospholipase L1-like esterase n=1 Tax=Prauserella shujinwangii TaxID=1453103 RepID=A0A2T0LP12_9PSEU|nr:SGNH/GDSL hydrolase family protein [Prauserella shujinwangii]PRX44906.1 lysophospholipase L1-like esterase [Prauserella shujinwangii]
MSTGRRFPGLLALGALVAAAVLGAQATALSVRDSGTAGQETAAAPERGHWVHTWVAMPQLTEPHNMPPDPFTGDDVVLADTTLRQTVRVTVGARQLRLRFSNAFGGAALPITAVSVALPAGGEAGAGAIQPGTARPVTFNGKAGAEIPVGAQLVSDPLPFPVAAGTNLSVTTYLADGQASTDITSHPGSRTTSHLLAGNHVTDADLPGATPTNHWYFLSGVEVWTGRDVTGTVIVGDSLTDGRGSTTNGNDRWPDQLFDRLQADRRTSDAAILNQAAGGNRVLRDGLGPNVLARLDRDVLAVSGARSLIVFEGVNDIGTAEPTEAAQKEIADDLIAAYEQIIDRAHAQGIRVYGATLLPFGGNASYDDPDGHRKFARQAVNRWIRTSHRFDAVLDFDAAVRDPARPERLLPAADEGDHLHLNPTGYRMLADAVPARLFR